jgi:PAS domain S-box-containing protein
MISTALAEALLRTETDAIVASDKQALIQFWNPGAERIFGYTHADAIGQPLDIIIPPRLRERHWLGYHRVMATGESQYSHGDVLAVPGKRKDGADISLEFTIIPLRDQTGQITILVAIMRDVTARFQEMNTLRRKLAAVNG